jgi:hypothetical protein
LNQQSATQQVQDAYASGDKDKIAAVTKQYPGISQKVAGQQVVQHLSTINAKVSGYTGLLKISPTLDDWNQNLPEAKALSSDGTVPQFKDNAEYQQWRQQVLPAAQDAAIKGNKFLQAFHVANDPNANPIDRQGAQTYLKMYQQQHEASIKHLEAVTNKPVKPQGAPTTNDLNDMDAGIASNPVLSGLTPDVPKTSTSGYQVKDRGMAESWMANNTNALLRKNPNMQRNEAINISSHMAGYYVDPDGHFDPNADVKTINGKPYQILSKNKDGSLTIYDPYSKTKAQFNPSK